MARYRQRFTNQLLLLVSQGSIRQPRRQRHAPDPRRQYAAMVKVETIRGFRRVIRSSAGQLNRSATCARDVPNLAGALGSRKEEHPLTILGPGRDLGASR